MSILIRRGTGRKATLEVRSGRELDDGIGMKGSRLSTWRTKDQREAAKHRWLGTLAAEQPAWVFAYGSLMWNPGFEYKSVLPATIYGYHRRFCIFSHFYRGTPEAPGLVFGLDRGGSCRGRVFQIAPSQVSIVLGAIWDREMIYRGYVPRKLFAQTDNWRLTCHTFVANPRHEQYAGRMDIARTARVIARARGKAGSNADYLTNTLDHLEELGLRDGNLTRLQAAVRSLGGS